MLYQGNMEEVARQEEQSKKAKVFMRKHDVYRNTKVTSVAQEEQSALAAGVLNQYEDSDDDDAYTGEGQELVREIDELRVAKSWINQDGWNLAAEGRAVCEATGRTIDLRLDWGEVRSKLAQGADGENGVAADPGLEEYPLEKLDPTQRVFVDRVLEWAGKLADTYDATHKDGRFRKPPLLRIFLGGSAGSGKSTTLKTTVQHVRALFRDRGTPADVELTAYTGVAAFNIGLGARTACAAFQIFPNATWKKELSGAAFRKLERTWRNVELLIVDELSFIGRAFFARMHHRMQQGRRAYFSEKGLKDPEHSFGNISIILVGDFGQLEPIDDWSLCDNEATYAKCPAKLRHLWRHAQYSKTLLGTFKEAVMLEQIHRSKEDMWWTESCLRLRDFTMDYYDDYCQWYTHDLRHEGHFNKDQKMYFDNKAVWICARCEDVGCRNGRKLAHMALDNQTIIHQIHAMHSNKSARKQSTAAFDGLRPVINLVRGCKVMICRNVAYLHGLANGTRGTMVGVVYESGATFATDKPAPFPEAIIVDIPDYKGPVFYSDQPTWVPILPMTSRKEQTRLTRTQFPLVAGFALTINKAQGLTMKEGVVIHLEGSRRYRPASKHGLAFVAFTRSESFAMTAFKNLPPWADFEKGKQSDMLRQRLDFTRYLTDALHRKTMARHSSLKTERAEQIAQELWREAQRKHPKPDKEAHMTCPGCAAAGH